MLHDHANATKHGIIGIAAAQKKADGVGEGSYGGPRGGNGSVVGVRWAARILRVTVHRTTMCDNLSVSGISRLYMTTDEERFE